MTIVFLEQPSQRLSENVIATSIDERIDTQVDKAESNKDVKPFKRQHSALITT